MKKKFFALLMACVTLSASPLATLFAEQGNNANNTSANIVQPNAGDEKVADTEDFSVPIISIRTKGPSAVEADRPATYNVKVRNISSKKDASVKVVVRYPAGCGFMDADPQPEFIREGAIEYTLPNLARLTEQDLNITLSPPKTGNMDLNVVCSLEADNNVKTVVKRPRIDYDIDGPPTGVVNVPIPMEISLKNSGDGIVRGAHVFSEVPEGIVLDAKTTERLLKSFDIQGGETKKIKFNVIALQEGRHNLKFGLNATNMTGKTIQTGISVTRPTLDIHFVGPSKHIAGQQGDYTMVIENNTKHAIESAELDLEIPEALRIEKVSRYGDYFRDDNNGIHMVWPIMKVAPGKRINIRLRAKALTVYKENCNIQLRFSDGTAKNISYSVGAYQSSGEQVDTASNPVDLTETAELTIDNGSTNR